VVAQGSDAFFPSYEQPLEERIRRVCVDPRGLSLPRELVSVDASHHVTGDKLGGGTSVDGFRQSSS